MEKSALIPLLLIWAAATCPLILLTFRQASSGLVAGYCFQMWMLYWLGAVVHALPWSELPDPELTVLGFQQATYGMVAFAIGVLALGPSFGKALLGKQDAGDRHALDPDLPRKYIIAGLVFYFLLAPTIGQYPGLNAVPAVGSQLVVVGCCLRCWLAWHKSGNSGLIRTLIPTLLIPLVILARQGFLSFGVVAISIILVFTARMFRPRWILAIGALVAGYMGLTVYVSYMRDREEIRATFRAGGSLPERLSPILNTIETFEWFSPHDDNQLSMIDARLDQNLLVGAAVDNLSRTGEYFRGSTVVDAVLAMIPRLIWQNKPMRAGSGGLVTQLTGIEFARGTSVGVGPVMEAYGNFGTPGVLIGFLLLGAIVRALDICAGVQLEAGNWPRFMTTFLVGISTLNVAGSLVEITAGAAASLVVAKLVNRVLNRRADMPNPALQAAT